MLSARQRNNLRNRGGQSAQVRSSPQNRISQLERIELEEKYFKSVDQVKELKTKNNVLQEDVKSLKARLRWPPHIQDKVLSKESQQEENMLRVLESRNMQLAEKCDYYERTIRQLEDRLDVKQAFEDRHQVPERSLKSHDEIPEPHIKMSERGNEKATSSSQMSAMKLALEEWRDHANCYKQQAEEAVSRLKDTEERLAQMLRLHTLDSAELIRTSRTSKHAVAQLTAIQEENRHYKAALEKMKEKFGENTNQLETEKMKNVELQENLEQVRQLRLANAELLQEIEEVKQERSVVQTQLQNLVRDATQATQEEAEASRALRRQLDTVQMEHSAALKTVHQALEDKSQEVADLMTQEKVLREQIRKLQLKKQEPVRDIPRDNKSTQTINLEIDLKPPQATVELSNEESDRMLSQMNFEMEQYKKTMRSMQSMCETYKKELAEMHEQLQSERINYARQLSLEMTQFKALQEQLKNCSTSNQVVVTADVEPAPKPKPKPRKIIKQTKEAPKEDNQMKELVLEIESLSLPEGSFVLNKKDLQFFFVDFKLSCPTLSKNTAESHETPDIYPLPATASTPVPVGHKHTWQVSDFSALMEQSDCFIQFDLVSENEETAPDESVEIGVGKLPLSELMAVAKANVPVNLSVPVCIEEKNNVIVAHLKISLTKVTN